MSKRPRVTNQRPAWRSPKPKAAVVATIAGNAVGENRLWAKMLWKVRRAAPLVGGCATAGRRRWAAPVGECAHTHALSKTKAARGTAHADDLSSARSARNPSTTGSPCGRSVALPTHTPPGPRRPRYAHQHLRLTTCRAMTGSCHEDGHGCSPLQRTRRDTAAAASILRVSSGE